MILKSLKRVPQCVCNVRLMTVFMSPHRAYNDFNERVQVGSAIVDARPASKDYAGLRNYFTERQTFVPDGGP